MRYKKLNEKAHTPTRGTEESAGFDLYALVEKGVTSIRPKETVVIHTGIAVEIPWGYFGAIYARSGLATNRGIRPSNCTGIVDSDYRGEVLLAMYNDSDETQMIYHGDRIAQLIIQPCDMCFLEEVTELSETKRAAGGFGSTGR